jgi:hypothetical protein
MEPCGCQMSIYNQPIPYQPTEDQQRLLEHYGCKVTGETFVRDSLSLTPMVWRNGPIVYGFELVRGHCMPLELVLRILENDFACRPIEKCPAFDALTLAFHEQKIESAKQANPRLHRVIVIPDKPAIYRDLLTLDFDLLGDDSAVNGNSGGRAIMTITDFDSAYQLLKTGNRPVEPVPVPASLFSRFLAWLRRLGLH